MAELLDIPLKVEEGACEYLSQKYFGMSLYALHKQQCENENTLNENTLRENEHGRRLRLMIT